jgi:hypothetical protein
MKIVATIEDGKVTYFRASSLTRTPRKRWWQIFRIHFGFVRSGQVDQLDRQVAEWALATVELAAAVERAGGSTP